jgi:hypothetical protein
VHLDFFGTKKQTATDTRMAKDACIFDKKSGYFQSIFGEISALILPF